MLTTIQNVLLLVVAVAAVPVFVYAFYTLFTSSGRVRTHRFANDCQTFRPDNHGQLPDAYKAFDVIELFAGEDVWQCAREVNNAGA